MASMSRSLGSGLARSRLCDESAAVLRCPACFRRQALHQPALRPRQISPSRPLAPTPASRRAYSQKSQQRPRFTSRLRMALGKSKTEWYFIPVGVGIGFLGLAQGYKVYTREKERQEDDEFDSKPKRRPRVRPEGPWQVRVMSTLPLKALSRLWGKFNEVDIPYYFRVPGFKLYSWIFGVNLDEVSEPDLHVYPNLAAFFYRTLKPGVRPLDPDHNALLSPSDGKVLQFGQIQGGDIEQVKGMTYSIDALLGKNTPTPSIRSGASTPLPDGIAVEEKHRDAEIVKQDEEFARVNGISYTLPNLLTGPAMSQNQKGRPEDQSTAASPTSVSEVRADLALGEKPWYDLLSQDNPTSLYYAVIYLAPGDYHRFHSPANWVVERRRHFAGELYSVSPYLQRTLPGLFTLNERVVLLGRWRWGFFSYVPVGATNVGSIKINFDRELRTNSLTTDTAADRAAEEAAARGEPYTGFSEAGYAMASPVLQGHALRRGEEMGGFQLGSTIVLIFEAPLGQEDESGKLKGGWVWKVEKGQKIKMGQALGRVDED
ncbi:phosphatidylserine decarboxylase [Diaporthe helianthi]|uniref:Phosphatidylserine decarboxylase proenzyme 1, mitochondrial n=1 Tax=Diaporthe helianthi TaxID=158607 RepID=A0A2P5IA53_DIAHE|nr:phosphatidylserine decarboxylase [Diaporthe helianthi]